MTKNLKELLINHKGKLIDKWSSYAKVYDQILSPYKEKSINLFEIGVFNGGSLELWAEYFINAQNIVGCDIINECAQLQYEDPRISIIIGDANTNSVEEELSELSPDFDIIIDDGSHRSKDIISSFIRYFKHLNHDGVYIFEDLHASYWKGFGGGLHYPYSAMSFFKRLADIPNFEHWHLPYSKKDYFQPFFDYYQLQMNEYHLSKIHSIDFYNSLCVIHTNKPDDNKLGNRIVAGSESHIVEDFQPLNGTTIHDMAVETVLDLKYDKFYLLKKQEELEKDVAQKTSRIQGLEKDVAKKTSRIQDLEKQANQLEQELKFYATSTSWQITRPFRKLRKIFTKKPD